MLPSIEPAQMDAVDRLARIDLLLGLLLRNITKDKISAAGLPQLFRESCPMLIYLHRYGSSQLGAIAAGTGRRPAALTHSAKLLVSRGLAVRYEDPEDARACRLDLTELGERYAILAEKARAEAVGELLSGMNKVQRAHFEECLGLVCDTLQKIV